MPLCTYNPDGPGRDSSTAGDWERTRRKEGNTPSASCLWFSTLDTRQPIKHSGASFLHYTKTRAWFKSRIAGRTPGLKRTRHEAHIWRKWRQGWDEQMWEQEGEKGFSSGVKVWERGGKKKKKNNNKNFRSDANLRSGSLMNWH